MNKPAAIYARVSSDRQKENHTIASQTAALIEYAQKNGYSVPPEWVFQDEGYSGAILVRPGLESAARSGGGRPDRCGAGLLARPAEPKVRLSGLAERGTVALRGGVDLSEGAGRSHAGGSTSGAVSGHDRRIRTRPDRRAVPARQKAHGATGRGERAFRSAFRLPIREEERHLGSILRGDGGRGQGGADGV